MSAEVIELHDRRKPEDRSACETRLFLVNMGLIFNDALAGAPPLVTEIAHPDGEYIPDTSPCEMVPYHGAGVDGIPFSGKFD